MAIGDQSGHQVDREVVDTAVTSMSHLRDIFQLVGYRLNKRSLAQHELVKQGQQTGLHVLAQAGNERKLAPQVLHDVLGVIGLEIAIAGHVEVNDDRHVLADGQARLATGTIRPAQNRLWELDGKHLAKIIDIDEEVQ